MIPLSLYIHIPWCIKKCPYCDFNSHQANNINENDYIDALLNDFYQDTHLYKLGKGGENERQLHSIFIGGGTPSLLTAAAYERLFAGISQHFNLNNIEITLEANPGTAEQQRFSDYRKVGINRLSLGIQSFDKAKLSALGRIHDDNQAHHAIDMARRVGFDNFNLDIMHGLPKQTIEQGIADLTAAIKHHPPHLSWYQLTIEPNTVFYNRTPTLASDDELAELESQGLDLLKNSGYERYEISAFNRNNNPCHHNINYWQFGDYLAIGAGAHGKLTTKVGVLRWQKYRQPKDYLHPDKPFTCKQSYQSEQELIFEFMLNTTRLEQTIPYKLFQHRTGLAITALTEKLHQAEQQNLVNLGEDSFQVTALGRRFTNELQMLFM